MHPRGAPQMGCVEHDWWCRNVMTSNTDQMVGVNVQCTWNGVSGKIDDMVSISQADRMVGQPRVPLERGRASLWNDWWDGNVSTAVTSETRTDGWGQLLVLL